MLNGGQFWFPDNEPFRFRTFLHASYDLVFSIRALPMMISKTGEVLEVGGERIIGMPVYAAAAGAYAYMFKATRRSVESVQRHAQKGWDVLLNCVGIFLDPFWAPPRNPICKEFETKSLIRKF